MALESFDSSAHPAFLEAIEQAEDQWYDGLSAFVTQIEAIKDAIDSEYGAERYAQLNALRQARSGELVFHARNIQAHVRAICNSSGVNIPFDSLGFVESLRRMCRFRNSLFEYSGGTRNGKYPSRGPSRGAITPPTNVKIWALSVTEEGYVIQGGFGQTVRFRVENGPSDQQLLVSVNKDRADLAGRDWIEQLIDSAGAPTPIDIPGFDRYRVSDIPYGNPFLQSSETVDEATIGTSELSSWTVGTADKWRLDTGNTLRSLSSLEMRASGNVAGDFNLSQNIGQIDGARPYLPVLVVENNGTFVGTVRATRGTQYFTKTNADMTGAGTIDFLTPTISSGALGKLLWARHWVGSSTPTIAFQCDTLTSGNLNLMALLLLPGTYHPGTGQWFFVAGGDGNPITGAVGSQVVSFSDGSIIQRILNACGFVLEGRPAWLNATTGDSSISDP